MATQKRDRRAVVISGSRVFVRVVRHTEGPAYECGYDRSSLGNHDDGLLAAESGFGETPDAAVQDYIRTTLRRLHSRD